MAPQGSSVPATVGPTVGQDRRQTTPSLNGQPGPSGSQAEAPSVPPLGHELGRSDNVEQSDTFEGHGHEQKSGTSPPESGTPSASVSRSSDSVVLPQMQHADLQNVQQVRNINDSRLQSSTLSEPYYGLTYLMQGKDLLYIDIGKPVCASQTAVP